MAFIVARVPFKIRNKNFRVKHTLSIWLTAARFSDRKTIDSDRLYNNYLYGDQCHLLGKASV